MAEKNNLVFTYAYMMDNTLGLPKGLPGYFVGNPDAPTKGRWEGRNNLGYAVAKAAKESISLATLVDMNFEGLVRDSGMTLLLQPIQENPEDYQTVNQLIKKYLPDHKFINSDSWQRQSTIVIK